MRDDMGGKAESVADQMEIVAELNKESYFTSGTCQEPSIRRERIEGAEEAQALHEFAAEGIDRDHALGFQFAERDMNSPAIGCGRTQAVIGQVDAFTDAHAGVAKQQEDISTQIVAAQELLLEELILLGGERPWQSVRRARDG